MQFQVSFCATFWLIFWYCVNIILHYKYFISIFFSFLRYGWKKAILYTLRKSQTILLHLRALEGLRNLRVFFLDHHRCSTSTNTCTSLTFVYRSFCQDRVQILQIGLWSCLSLPKPESELNNLSAQCLKKVGSNLWETIRKEHFDISSQLINTEVSFQYRYRFF